MDYSDREILNGIAAGDSRVIKYCYAVFGPKIRKFIKQRGGDESEAEDIFQEAMLILWEKKMESLSCSFSSFLHAICKFILYRKIEKNAKMTYISDMDYLAMDNDIEFQIEKAEKLWLIEKHISKLGPSCREILNLYNKGCSQSDIVDKFKQSDSYLRFKRSDCKKKLIESIKSDPQYLEIINNKSYE
ncbi:MAG: sigma-70 family RNA polymerase sigma factor [Bacteroidota bacterium]